MNKIEFTTESGKLDRIDLSQTKQRIVLNSKSSLHCAGDVYVNGVLCNYSLHMSNYDPVYFDIYRNDSKTISWNTRQKAETIIPKILIETINNYPNIQLLLLKAEVMNVRKNIQSLGETISEMEQVLHDKTASFHQYHEKLVNLQKDIVALGSTSNE